MAKEAEDQKTEQTMEARAVEMLKKLEADKERLTAQLNATQGAINGIKQLMGE